MRSQPDVLLVVLDCLRAKSIHPWSEDGVQAPYITKLAASSTVYTKCLSVASWSIPAHASLFTGLYPWTHGVYGRAEQLLSARSVFEDLALSGYRTLSLSANPFVSPRLGLTNGFDSAYWGNWASHYFRFLGSENPPVGVLRPEDNREVAIRNQGLLRRLAIGIADATSSAAPRSWKRIHTLASRINPSSRLLRLPSSPWIEPTLDAWLRSVPEDRPVACFVNLMDAHEPYLIEAERQRANGGSASQTRLLLDGHDRDSSDLAQDTDTLHLLEERYLRSIGLMDARLGRILEIFDSQRSDASKMMILTSDHGQCFGERGHVFHEYDAGDEVLRVPMLVRFPDGIGQGVVSNSWTSLIDVAPTLRHATDLDAAPQTEGQALQTLRSEKRRDSVLAISDGHTRFRQRDSFGKLGRTKMDQLTVVGCSGDLRVELCNPEWIPEVIRIRGMSGYTSEAVNRNLLSPSEIDSEATGLIGSALSITSLLRPQEQVSSRLSSWGY